MKLLLLNGHGIDMRVDGAKLKVKDGRYLDDVEPEKYLFSPKRIDVNSIIIYGRSGDISIEAIRWLIKHNVQVSILDWNGKLLTTMLPPEGVQVKTKFAQYSSYNDKDLKLEIAKKFIDAKIQRTKSVLEYLKSRYSLVQYDFSKEEEKLDLAINNQEIMLIEAQVAGKYWKNLIRIFPDKYEFETRKWTGRPMGAGDQINCMLNYGYAILEAECLRAINASGLDVHIGFLHEMNIGKNSLAYDLQEPFRFLIDLAIISAIEKGLMDKRDFIRTENYNLRLRPSGAKKLIAEIMTQFNKKVQYRNMEYTWSYLLMTQTRELAHYLIGKTGKLDFSQPFLELDRNDTQEMREKIKNISYYRWKKMGFSKGTLHHMKKNANSDKPFKIYKEVQKRLEEHENLEIKKRD